MNRVKGENYYFICKSHNKPFAPPHTEPHKKVHETRGFYYKLNYICNIDMEERKLNEKESLELITQTIQTSKAEYIEATKTFKGKMPCTLCRITPKGIEAFEEYVEALKTYIYKKL